MVAFFMALEKGLGFARSIVVARQFGASPALDAFYAANNLPDLLFLLISGGALAMAFIPALNHQRTRGEREFWQLFARVTNLVFLTTALLSLIVALLARPLVDWVVTPGFPAEQRALIADLMRLNLFGTLLTSLAGLATAALQARQHFVLPALGPSMYDVGALIGALIFAPQPAQAYGFGGITLPALGMGVHGLVYGTILGALLFVGVQIPGLLLHHWRWFPQLGWRDPQVQHSLSLILPRIQHMLFISLTFVVQDNLASRLNVEGAVTALAYGWLFMQVPETLLGTALGVVLLPTLAEQARVIERAAFRSTLRSSVQALLAITLPTAAVIMLVIQPVIALLGFDAENNTRVLWATRAFLLGLPGHALLEVASRAFYAAQDPMKPVRSARWMFALYVGFGIVFGWLWDAPGIALANALAFSTQAVLLLLWARRDFGKEILALGSTVWRAPLAAVLATLTAYLTLTFAPGAAAESALVQVTRAGAAGVLGLLATLPLIWRELKTVIRL
ncbi:MAG: murein biosynthesis integral membrane protein MurJ [Anaerolineales bacterium]